MYKLLLSASLVLTLASCSLTEQNNPDASKTPLILSGGTQDVVTEGGATPAADNGNRN